MPPGGPIPGDPEALEAGARVYGAAAEAWLALRTEVSNLAFGLAASPDWTGDAAEAFSVAARGLIEAADRGSGALREGAGALRAYAIALEQAQSAYAQAAADTAGAEGERSAAREAVLGVAAGALLPPPLLSRLDMADAAVGAAARAASAAVEEAQRAAREAAAEFRRVAGQARPAAEAGTAGVPREDDHLHGGVLGALERAVWWLGEQTLEFGDGFREGVVGLAQGLWTFVTISPVYYAINPEGTRETVRGFGDAIEFAVLQPGEFAKAVTNWQDIEEGRYAHWLGNLAPDAILAALTVGGGSAAAASTRGVHVVKAVDDVVQRSNPTPVRHTLKDINPGYTGNPNHPRSINCGKCVVALDESLAGRPSAALEGVGMSIPEMAKHFDSTFRVVSHEPIRAMLDIQTELLQAGPGARGIVFASRGNVSGHVFNAINDNGIVRFLDGQPGMEASFRSQGPHPYTRFDFMRTN